MSENMDKTSIGSSHSKSGRKYSLSESVSSESPNKRPIFKNLVTRLQFASRLARAQRNSFEEETDVVADDQEIKHFARQTSKVSPKKPKRPTKLTLRQFSQLSGKNPKIFGRIESKISDISGNDDDDTENGIISDGVLHFWKQFCYDEGHPFLRVGPNVDTETVAKVMHKCWDLDVPKIVTFIVSNKSHSTHWTNQRQIKNFQKGLIDAAISTNMWIFTNGINSGVANLIGNAIKNETNKMRIKRTLKNRNLTHLIGVVTEEELRYGEFISNINKDKIEIENQGVSYGDKYELDENHTHFILIRDKKKLGNCGEDFTIKFVDLLTRESLGRRPGRVSSTPESLDSDMTIESTEVPVVSIVIEGDGETVKLVLDLIKRHIPVVVLRGSGGIADMIAFAYLEITHRCPDLNSWDLDFIDLYLKPMLTKKIVSYYTDLKDNTLTRNLLRDRIIECVRLCKREERVYLTVLNMHNSSSCNLQNLSQHLLLALLKSRQSTEMLSTENFFKDLELTMDWNSAHVAKDVIFAKNPNNIIKLDKNIFESALMRPNREEFVELFLTLGFQCHKFLSPSRLNRLFKLIHDNEFYKTLCWESILGRPFSARPGKYFIDTDLNWLIELCTGLDNFVNADNLHSNVMGMYAIDSQSAERKALTLLSMWAVMQNRHELAKVFWKHSDQPVHLALVISMLFDRLSWYSVDNNMKSDLKQKSKEFGEYANGVLDVCYNEDVNRANNVLNQSIHDWNYKTAVDIAASAQLRQFLAHPCCQKFLTNTFLGNIRLREINWGLVTIPPSVKILLCAFLVFPLFVWVRFITKDFEIPEDTTKEEEFEDVYDDIYYGDNISASVITEDSVDQMKVGYVNPAFNNSKQQQANGLNSIRTKSKNRYQNYKMFVSKQPPLRQMLVMFFCAPITKFYMSQFFYILFLPLLSLSVIYPSCGFWELDTLVCFWTTILCIDYIRRTYILIKKYAAIPVFIKCVEICLIIAFIILFAINRVFEYHIYSPYKQKLLLSVGLLYFYYRLIGIYLPISPTLGPLLHRLKLMITVDFVNYMRIAALVILSNMIVMQAVLYPDNELSMEMFHKAFHRAFFALFLTPVIELETNDYCEKHAIIDESDDQCTITGRYNSTSCANSGVWAYAFFIQYFIFLKLILSTLLMAIFAATASKLQTDSDNIWKFQRYLLVIDFANRLPLPAPLSVFHYIYYIYRYFQNLFCNVSDCCRSKKMNNKVIISNQNEIQERYKLSGEECIYWRQLASDYIEELKAKADKDQIPYKQWEYIQNITEDLEYEKKVMREIKGKVLELERIIFNEKLSQTTYDTNKRELKTSLSRYSPYPGTRINRMPLSDKYIPWEVMHIDYEPTTYTKSVNDFPIEVQPFVDEDIILLKEIKTRNTEMKVKFPDYRWNSNEVNGNGVSVNRISWQINGDGTAFQYKLVDNFIPLNPFGRTGLRGRGGLARWGPNHYIIFIITRWQRRPASPSKNKNLELIVESIDELDKICLPERFVTGDDLFGEIRKLFKTDSKPKWVLPEVIQFFKSMCLSQDNENGFRFELIRNGYIDDPMNTDNAWKEAKVWHIHYDCREYLRKRLVEPKLCWRLLSDSLFSKMPLSHNHIIKSIVDSLKADII